VSVDWGEVLRLNAEREILYIDETGREAIAFPLSARFVSLLQTKRVSRRDGKVSVRPVLKKKIIKVLLSSFLFIK
jgi:hypothetical protein